MVIVMEFIIVNLFLRIKALTLTIIANLAKLANLVKERPLKATGEETSLVTSNPNGTKI